MKFNSTEQSIIWFRDRYNAGELILKPPFQRQPVWTEKQKNFLIESVLLELPIPELYVQHDVISVEDSEEDKSVYAVVDGQQRIRSVLQFIGVDQDEDEQDFNKFSLTQLPANSEYYGATFADLSKAQRDSFLKYKFSVRGLESADDGTVRDLFKRLNKYSTKLNEQELRNATFVGPFMKLAVDLADSPDWVELRLVTPAQIRRMKDVEFVSELVIGVIHGPQGGSAKAIDGFYTLYEEYDDEFPGQKQTKKRFDTTLILIRSLFDQFESVRFSENRTDFYSLFVAIAQLLIDHKLPKNEIPKAAKALAKFERQVDARLADDEKDVPQNVVDYVTAVQKGVNDKGRRADRHIALLAALEPHVS